MEIPMYAVFCVLNYRSVIVMIPISPARLDSR